MPDFPPRAGVKSTDPAVAMHPDTFAQLRRLELKAHRIAEAQCNGDETPDMAIVTAYGSDRDGRADSAIGAVPIKIGRAHV